MDYFYLILGFTILIISSDLLVKSGVALSSHFKVSTLVIGVTVVSFGTSLPELVVSVGAALKNHPDIAIGNVIGSNISNIGLVLGLTALIINIPVNKNSVRFDWPWMIFASILLYIFTIKGTISFIEGLLFLILLAVFIIWSVKLSHNKLSVPGTIHLKPAISIKYSLVLLFLSSAGLYFGATWLVEGAESIAIRMGVSERVISLTIIAFGTSVPELATSITAALKKELDISIGNIIGSNIFNIFGILGVTSVIKAVPVNSEMVFDLKFMIVISVLLFLLILPAGKSLLTRWKGVLLLLAYFIYITLVFNS